VITGSLNVIMGPWNVHRRPRYVNIVPYNVISGPWNVNREPWDVNRGPGM